MHAAGAHIGQHIERAARLRHKQRLAHQPFPVLWRRLGGGKEGKNVLDQHHADDLVERLPIDRHAAVAVLGEGGDDVVPAGRGRQRDDLAARDGDIIGVVFAEMQEVPQHLALERGKIAGRR